MVDDGFYYFSSYRAERDVMSWKYTIKKERTKRFKQQQDALDWKAKLLAERQEKTKQEKIDRWFDNFNSWQTKNPDTKDVHSDVMEYLINNAPNRGQGVQEYSKEEVHAKADDALQLLMANKRMEPETYEGFITERLFSPKFRDRWVSLSDVYETRREVFDEMQRRLSRRTYTTPRPWTMEGNLEEGTAIVYDDEGPLAGISIELGAPQYFYIIWPTKDKDNMPDPKTFNTRNLGTSPESLRQKLSPNPFEPNRKLDPETSETAMMRESEREKYE